MYVWGTYSCAGVREKDGRGEGKAGRREKGEGEGEGEAGRQASRQAQGKSEI